MKGSSVALPDARDAKSSVEGSGRPWTPCAVKGLTCDGVYHRGWDGHDPYLARCPRPRPRPDDVVGHKTLRNKEGQLYHEPLTRGEADELIASIEAAKAKRAADMPTETDAIRAMWDAYRRLEELGWRNAIYCPKDGSPFDAIEPGSMGIFRTHYSGTWPDGSWWAEDGGDLWPARPCLYRVTDAEKAKWDSVAEAFRARGLANEASPPSAELGATGLVQGRDEP